ncbi:zinc-dependent alcohol dehydrogenase [Marinitenerispora sediminis]|uniref:Glutathione-dependent formaldehyde dehydrogenase n=1 Tax=Marinitenerispora sediminis TaxID=1931232 RepID=A0A368T0V2_9ACTN|nr:zinc-dependent alcohol dehydrogenase [Marinitenerispora sediminis]RCV50840.1 glutathione-dependent formaldehyde dehydrogenase [Marinitenerispora sediminis]RCV51290.1 glutathione-dependent formaldehyde dehydrogenase [Marinitenerispora sediminis]RCV52888.1 glutathione-dependent formaldehyde dehydrogenase [Marinitenerispora sediminis]
MKAVVWHDVGDIRLDDVPEPEIRDPHDAIVQITTSAICGTDLHMVRGTVPGMREGTVLGHEAVGVVTEVGPGVRNFRPGDRVVVPSTIGCGTCSYCRAGYYAQCDRANPNGRRAGTAFFGGPESTGAFDGLQAERARVPYANVGLVPIPEQVSDEEAILLSDIFPTAWFGARLAEIGPGDTVAVFGCGPVGLFSIISARLQGAGRVLAVDRVPSRLEQARALHAEVVDFDEEDPVEALVELTGGIGPDRVIDAVGVDAVGPARGPGRSDEPAGLADEVAEVAPRTNPQGRTWVPGDAPSQAARWAVDALAKAGTLSVIGVYPPSMTRFPFGTAMNKNLAINMGNCHHRRYIPHLVDLVASGVVSGTSVLTQEEPLPGVIDAYTTFDRREPGWTKVALTTV